MPSDKANENMDELEDDEFDLDDFGDDDLADDSWNEADDEPDTGDEAAAPALDVVDVSEEETAPEAGKNAKAAKKAKSGDKTFLQKNINYIVIGLVVLGGGAFIGPKMLLKSSTAPAPGGAEMTGDDMDALPGDTVAVPEPAPELADGEMPPMPAPINPATDTGEALAPAAATDVLTPMPDLQQAENTTELQPLEEPAIPPVALKGEPVPEASVPVQAVDHEAVAPPELQAPEPAAPAAEEQVAPVAAVPAAPPIPSPAPMAAPPVDTAALEAVSGRIDSLEKQIADTQASQKDAAASISNANTKIDTLVNSLAALEKKISALSDAQEQLSKDLAKKLTDVASMPDSKPAAPEKPVPAKEPAPVKPAAKAAPVKTPPTPTSKPVVQKTADPSPSVKPAPAQEAEADWQLRSAQPGRAVVAKTGSDEMRNVATGDSLPGIGTITSISKEDGRWVVRGTKGLVQQ